MTRQGPSCPASPWRPRVPRSSRDRALPSAATPAATGSRTSAPANTSSRFSLTGFRGVRRDGIILPTSFTAQVNAELSLGQLQESVTVSGESPLVDVRGSASQSVMTREKLDTIPTGRDPFAVGQLIAGVTTSTPDVGGTQIMQQPTLQVHGSSNNDNVFMVDSVQIQHIGFGGNQTGFYFNDGLME